MSKLIGASIHLDVLPLFLGDPPASAGSGVSDDDPQDWPDDADDASHIEDWWPAPGTGGEETWCHQLDDGTKLGTWVKKNRLF